MGREIRRVPPAWQHPKDKNGHYRPCHNRSFNEAAQAWKAELLKWERGEREHFDPAKYPADFQYWEWSGTPPDRDSYRPEFTEEPTWFQAYENVTEGTPISPPFATEEELIRYLSTHKDFGGEGPRSLEVAEAFVRGGYVPSMVITGGKIYMGMESAVLKADRGE